MNTFHREQGFSLLEILTALVVLSIGLLGLAALMGVSLRYTNAAADRTQAVNIMHDGLDVMRSNLWNVGYFNQNTFSDPSLCNTPPDNTELTCDVVHTCEWQRVARAACTSLPNGRIRSQVERVNVGGSANVFQVTLQMCWQDHSRPDVAPTADCSGDGEVSWIMEGGL